MITLFGKISLVKKYIDKSLEGTLQHPLRYRPIDLVSWLNISSCYELPFRTPDGAAAEGPGPAGEPASGKPHGSAPAAREAPTKRINAMADGEFKSGATYSRSLGYRGRSDAHLCFL